MKENKTIEILDYTIRDGGYVSNWNFDKKVVREAYRALSKGGVDIVELGFRGSAKYFDPDRYGPWRFTSEADIHEVVTGIDGARIAVMGDYGKIDLEDLKDRKNTPVEMIRDAAHKNQVAQAIELLGRIKSKGYKTSLQAMGFTSYTDAEKPTSEAGPGIPGWTIFTSPTVTDRSFPMKWPDCSGRFWN